MAALPLKVSRNEQGSVFDAQEDVVQTPVSLRCVQCMATSVLQDQKYMFGVKVCSWSQTCCWWGRTWSPCCFDNRCNDHSSRFSHTVWLACDGI